MSKKNRKWYDSEKLDEKATNNYEKLEEEAAKIIQEKNIDKKILNKRKCPICEKEYTEDPAISRKDNKNEICPQCGTEEALLDFFEENENHIPKID